MAIDIQATDHFGLDAEFIPQSSTSPHTEDYSSVLSAVGDVLDTCETAIFGRTEYTTTYKYCAATQDIKGDLGTFLTSFGAIAGSIMPTSITITWNLGAQADVEITGVKYDENPTAISGTANVASVVPASSGFGVPTLAGVTLGANASCESLSMTFSMDHKPIQDGAGDHLMSSNITFRGEVTAGYNGIPTTYVTTTDWTTDTYDSADSNSDHDSAAYTGHKNFAKA